MGDRSFVPVSITCNCRSIAKPILSLKGLEAVGNMACVCIQYFLEKRQQILVGVKVKRIQNVAEKTKGILTLDNLGADYTKK